MAADPRPTLVGNRMVLAGAVLYLLEWVAIDTARVSVPVGAGASAAKVLDAYVGHASAFAWAAGWFSVVLLGRVLITTGLRSALAASGRPQPLMDLAVVAMAVSVTLEIAVYALTAGASWTLANGGAGGTVRGLDAAAFMLNQMLFGPLGVAVLCSGWAMWRSGLFARVLCLIGIVSGAGGVVLGVAFASPSYAGVAQALNFSVALFWVWMLWTGVVLWRRTSRSAAPAGTLSAEHA